MPSTEDRANFMPCICEVESWNCSEVYILVEKTKSKETIALLCGQWVIKLKDEVLLPQPWGIRNSPGRGLLTGEWRTTSYDVAVDCGEVSRGGAHCHLRMKMKSENEVVHLCLTLRLKDCSLPGSSVHEIFQAGVLEWAAISFCRWSSQPRDWTQVSCIVGRLFTV